MILQSSFLNATPKYFMFPNLPKFQAMHQLGHVFLCCDIPTVPLEYTTGAQIFPINAQLHCSSYKWQLHVSATQQPSGCLCGMLKGNFIPAASTQLEIISGRRYLSLTYKGI